MERTSPAVAHRWKFYRAGGVDQVRLDTGPDILNLKHLDQKLWVALSCPVKGLEFDERTLALLDADGDGRVRVPELLAAIEWLRPRLRSADDLVRGADGVPLVNLDDRTPEGRALIDSARHILRALGRESAGAITVAETERTAEIFAKARWNGDGVVPPASLEDEEARRAAEDLLRTVGGTPDRSGQPGFDRARLDAFLAALEAYAAWHGTAASDAARVLPLGDATPAALAAVEAVRAKVDDWFARCAMAAFDPRAQAALNREETAWLEVAAQDLSITSGEVAHFPLARVEPDRPLSLGGAVNPAWAAALAALRERAVKPLLGDREALPEAEWRRLTEALEPHRAWVAAKAGAVVEPLGIARVREILAGGAPAALAAALASDLDVARQVDGIADVARLARYYRDLHRLLNNFVSFTDFYARRGAIFQAGTLYLDGRNTDLCVTVNDGGKHAALAAMARMYLAYVDCTRPSGERKALAAAFTAGDSDNLFVGRNGVFYDRAGRDWDATITRIVDNPISISQAFWSPYKKVLRWIEAQVAKRAAAADEAAHLKLVGAAETAGEAAATGKAPVPKPKLDVGVVAALGVAVGGITAALGALLQAFFGLGIWMPIGFLGLILLISGPSMLIAYLKLRQRNLGPLLDANGWAVNTLTRINMPLGRSLTAVATLPPGAQRSLKDPYAPKRSPWPRLVLLLLVLGGVGYGLWRTGHLSRWLPWIPPPKEESPCDPPPTPGPAGTVPPAR